MLATNFLFIPGTEMENMRCHSMVSHNSTSSVCVVLTVSHLVNIFQVLKWRTCAAIAWSLITLPPLCVLYLLVTSFQPLSPLQSLTGKLVPEEEIRCVFDDI